MSKTVNPSAEQRQYYEKLIGCTIVRVLWDKIGEQALPILVLSTPGGGNAECVVFSDQRGTVPGYLRHDI